LHPTSLDGSVFILSSSNLVAHQTSQSSYRNEARHTSVIAGFSAIEGAHFPRY